MIRGIIIAVLALAVAGTGFWGYQEHQEKNAILINAENNYQRAFHDLTYQIDLLHDKIGTTLAMNSRRSLSPALAEVWKITSEAHNDVGQLPLSLLPFNKTEEFLSRIGEFSYRAAVRDLEKEPLSGKEYKSLQVLYKQAADVQGELRKVQHMVLKNNLRWMDVELALASGKEATDNTIIDGFKTVEKTVEGYTETELGPASVSMRKREENFQHLKGRKISKTDAIRIAKKYAAAEKGAKVRAVKNGKGSDYGFYSVSIQHPNGTEANMDITKVGGYPIWFIFSRNVSKPKISLNTAGNRAVTFLKENKFSNLEMFESAQYDNLGVFTFVTVQNGVRIYPEAIRIKVALDNGGIVGFSANEYLKSHQTRKLPEATLSSEKARKKINPKLKVMEEHRALIINDLNQEVLCHEFLGTLGEDTYRIFINAQTGEEEKVDKLKNAEEMFEDVI